MLDGRPAVFAPGERFAHCNAGYVLLALLTERATGTPFTDLVGARVRDPAGMVDTAFLRSDDLPERTASGYLDAEGDRTNVLHLPVRGTGDGGACTTVADVHRLWVALRRGSVIDPDVLADAWRARSELATEHLHDGLGFWLRATGPGVMPEGDDAGVSFRTHHDPESDATGAVIGSWSDAAWPIARVLDELLHQTGDAPAEPV